MTAASDHLPWKLEVKDKVDKLTAPIIQAK